MKRWLALALGVLILALGLWALRAFLAGAPQPTRAASPAVAPRAALTAADAPVAVPDRERDVAGPEPTAGARESARAAVESAPPTEALALQQVDVVDGLTRAPLAGARLRYAVIGERWPELEEHPGWKLDTCDAWFAEHGSEAQSGADGRAELRAPAGSLLLIAAWAPERFARTTSALDPEQPLLLALKPDVTLEVRVVDAGGGPIAGASVALRRLQSTWRGWPEHVRASDAGGRVVYPHVGATVDLVEESWAVVAPSLLGRVEALELDPRALPEVPLVLTFPATGSVAVRVTAAPGMPAVADDVEVALLMDEGRPDDLLSFWTRPHSVQQRVDDGLARFDFVPLGLDLIAEAQRDGGRMPTRARGRGPDAVGATASLTVSLGGDHPVLRLRLLDGEGVPLAQRELQAVLEDSATDESQLESDAAGRVLVEVPAARDATQERTLTLAVTATDVAPAARARLRLPDGLVAGVNDLGDLTLAPDRPLVSGRVVGPDGAPREGAAIHLAALPSFDEGETWVNELPATARSAADGGFVVYGADPGATLRVTAESDGHRSAPVDCAVGSAGLLLELVAVGSLAGRVRVDDGVDPTALTVELEPEGQGLLRDYRNVTRSRVQADGRFQFWQLAPGPWALTMADSVGRAPVLRLGGLEVPSGGPSTDARLAEIDLRGRLTVVRLSLRTPQSSDMVMGSLTYRPAGSPPDGADQSTAFLHDANVSLCVVGRAADVRVAVNGFRAVELAGVRGDVTVELERGPAVRLRLPPGTELPKPPRFLKPYLAAAPDTSSMGGHFQQVVFDERREVLLHAPTHGRLQVQWFMEERGANTLSTSTLEVAEAQWIDVLDVAAEQVFEVVVPDFAP